MRYTEMDRRREPDQGRDGEDMLKVSDIRGPHCRVTREAGLGDVPRTLLRSEWAGVPGSLLKLSWLAPTYPELLTQQARGGPKNLHV